MTSINRAGRTHLRALAMGAGLLLAGCVHLIAPYDADVARDVQSLRKKVVTLYSELLELAPDAAPNSGQVIKIPVNARKQLQQEWHDVLSDADGIQMTACDEPHNEDVCSTAGSLYADLAAFEKLVMSSRATVNTTTISFGQMKDRLGSLYHDENYKQNASSSSSAK